MLSVRSSSNDHDDSTGPLGAFDLDCYNSLDERLRLNHLEIESSPNQRSPRTPVSK